ncbi:MAG TPA: hypothetical protein VGB40_11100, partial [Rubrobacteraceae bacterium]
PLVVSSWPLYLAKGEIITAVDSKARRIDNYMPLTVTTPERSLILGGPDDEPELYDLARDPQERENTWATSNEGALLAEQALSFLEGVRTPEEYLAPRRLAPQRFAPNFSRGSAATPPNSQQDQIHNASKEAV